MPGYLREELRPMQVVVGLLEARVDLVVVSERLAVE